MRWRGGIHHRGVTKGGIQSGIGALLACLLIIGSGCSHVSRDELATDLDAVRAEMLAEQQDSADRLDGRIDGVEQRLDGRIDQLERSQADTIERMALLEGAIVELETRFEITVEYLKNAIAFNVPVHFGFDSSTLDENQTGTLDGFAEFYDDYYKGDLVTVEGFTDEAGSEQYNHQLGKRRAEEVKSYLTEIAGLDASVLRTISYGESYGRLVAPGEYGHKAGQENRRVVLVVDQSAHASAAPGEKETDNEGGRQEQH